MLPLPNPETGAARRRDSLLDGPASGLGDRPRSASLALAVTWAIARSSVRPLGALRAATRELAHGRLGTRVEPRGSREMVELGPRLQRHGRRPRAPAPVAPAAAARRRARTAHAAHRPPMSPGDRRRRPGARSRRRPCATCTKTSLHLGSLVDDLQDIALAEAGELRLSIADHAASDVVRSALRAAGLDGDARVQGRRARRSHAARRARRAPADPGEPAVQCQPTHASRRRHRHLAATTGDEARLTVRNTGSHLTPEECARVFDRFYRTDPSRQQTTGGTGLGPGDRQAPRRGAWRPGAGRERR